MLPVELLPFFTAAVLALHPEKIIAAKIRNRLRSFILPSNPEN
jgi:hypothetical protein